MVHSEIEQMRIEQRSALFYRHFFPLRLRMVAVLADSYRQYFKIALAHPSKAGDDPDSWAWTQLQLALYNALEWMRDWYILACEGENRRLRRVGSTPFVPGEAVSIPITFGESPFPPPTLWRAPTWLFGVSLVVFGIGVMKPEHVPGPDSGEKLGAAHSRLLLKGAKRALLLDLGAAIGRIQNEEIAAAGTSRVGLPAK